MELSFGMDWLRAQRGSNSSRDIKDMARLCRDAGFRYVDYSPEFRSADWAERAKYEREIVDTLGIIVHQTHAPFNRYGAHPEEYLKTYYWNLFKASKIIGAKYIVVHADEYRTVDRYDEREIQDFAYDFLAPYVDYARANGMTVAIENVFEDTIRRCPQINGKSRFTSRIHELKELLERFNDDAVQCCWDFGHAACAFGTDGMTDALRQVGKYVQCTHVHDNYYGKDLHVLPFHGNIRWEEQMICLKEIGYKGTFSFELAYGCLPDALLSAWLKNVYETGKYLVQLFDKAIV